MNVFLAVQTMILVTVLVLELYRIRLLKRACTCEQRSVADFSPMGADDFFQHVYDPVLGSYEK